VPQIQQSDFIAQQQRGADLRSSDDWYGHRKIPGGRAEPCSVSMFP
jgi:hypothetical protein